MTVWVGYGGALVAGFLLSLAFLHLAAAVHPHGGDEGPAPEVAEARPAGERGSAPALPAGCQPTGAERG